MKREVVLSEPALADLLDINDYYLCEVSDCDASNIIDGLETVVINFAEFPDMGSIPKELLSLGILQYRQIIQKPSPIKLSSMQYSMGGAICKAYSCGVFYEDEESQLAPLSSDRIYCYSWYVKSYKR